MEDLYSEGAGTDNLWVMEGKGYYVGTNAEGWGGVYLITASVFLVKKEADHQPTVIF